MTDKEENIKIITKDSAKRLLYDVKDIMLNPLADHGIYYIHDEEDILKGYALIIGPSDCIYSYGNFFFEFTFPTNYPQSPPTLTYLTNDGHTRFHPNLYRNGKVCLSILNTWKGEQWTSCQTIRSVLMTLITLFHNKSFLNEPGITEKNEEFDNYHKIIEYKVIETAIIRMTTLEILPKNFTSFIPMIKDNFKKNYNKIVEKLNKLENEKEETSDVISCRFYNMKLRELNYNYLLKEIQNLGEIYKLEENKKLSEKN